MKTKPCYENPNEKTMYKGVTKKKGSTFANQTSKYT